MWNHLGIWSKKYGITHGAMNELKISKCEGHRLPKDSRTIRKTPSAVTISEICLQALCLPWNSEWCYFIV